MKVNQQKAKSLIRATTERVWKYEPRMITNGFIILKDFDEPHAPRLYYNKFSTEITQEELELIKED